jgi:hypothetical protein
MIAGVNTWLINKFIFYIDSFVLYSMLPHLPPSDSILSEDAEIEPRGRILKRNTAQKAQLDLGLP